MRNQRQYGCHYKISRKHNYYIDQLVNKFKGYDQIDSIFWNVQYPLGEIDVLLNFRKSYVAYIEVKCNFTEKGYKKAKEQTQRWAHFQTKMNNGLDYLMFMYAGREERLIYLGRNGIFRNES